MVDEHDLTHVAEQRDADVRTIIRQAAADQPIQDNTDVIRVSTAEETADTVARAQRALAELDERRARDEQRAAEDARGEELTRWHADGTTRAPAAAERQRALVD